MNGRQRENLTMRHLAPDRVPVHCQLSIGHHNLNGGFRPHEIWYDTDAFVEATVNLHRRYRFDGLLVVLTGRPPGYLKKNVKKIETGPDGEWVFWRSGDRTFLPWDDMPHHYPADPAKPQRAIFETFDPDHDFDRVDEYLGFVWNIFYHMQEVPEKSDPGLLTTANLPGYLLRAIDLVKMKTGGKLALHGSVYSPLTLYFELFGYENALVGLAMDSGRAHAVLDRLADMSIAWAQALIGRGVDAIDLSSAFVAAPFISRKMYREFVVPYERKVNEAIKEAGAIIYTHTCGSIGDRLDLMVETGTLGIDTLDPPPLGNGDLARAKRDFGDNLFFKGNLNSVALLNYRSPEEVKAEVLEKLEIGKPGAGFILGTACSVAPRVEPWKLEMLVPLSEEAGRY